MPPINIDPLSVQSLHLELRTNGQRLGTATGIVLDYNTRHCLITNWHVLAGRNPDTGESLSDTGGFPDEVVILHNASQALGTWTPISVPLQDAQANALWNEHPEGSDVDVVALPLSPENEPVKIYPFNLALS